MFSVPRTYLYLGTIRDRRKVFSMNYGKSELLLIESLYDKGLNREDIAKHCNEVYYAGRPIRTARSIEFALSEKLKRTDDRFSHICEVCKSTFRSGWPNARYCGDECRAVIDREYANKQYQLDPKKNVLQQTIRARKKYSDRWVIILNTLGNKCRRCKKSYPIVVYDLHHPNGKRSRKETPSKIIRTGTDEVFQQMLNEVEILCANCHRLHHAETGDWAPMRKGK